MFVELARLMWLGLVWNMEKGKVVTDRRVQITIYLIKILLEKVCTGMYIHVLIVIVIELSRSSGYTMILMQPATGKAFQQKSKELFRFLSDENAFVCNYYG